jgi:hypothetical protein
VIERTVEAIWPDIQRGLAQHDLATLGKVEIRVANLEPSVDPSAFALAIADKIANDGRFVKHRPLKVRFVFPRGRRA